MSDLDEFRERYRRSLEAFIKGDAEPQKKTPAAVPSVAADRGRHAPRNTTIGLTLPL